MMKFEGIMPALVTPLNADESINVDVLRALIKHLLDKDADGFYIGGATGEGLAIRTEERMILAEEAIAAVDHKKPCIVQIASMDFGDAIALAKHAERIGADAISATPPLFFAYDEDDVYNYYKALASAVHIPMMIYYNPNARFDINASFAARAFEVDNITAIKWTSMNYYEMMKIKELTHGEMNVINGPDEALLMGLSAGADGGIGTTYNFMLDIIKGVYNSFRSGEMEKAREYQKRANLIINELLKGKVIPVTKVVLEAQGFSVGNAAFPMTRYSDDQKRDIIERMKKAGLEF